MSLTSFANHTIVILRYKPGPMSRQHPGTCQVPLLISRTTLRSVVRTKHSPKYFLTVFSRLSGFFPTGFRQRQNGVPTIISFFHLLKGFSSPQRWKDITYHAPDNMASFASCVENLAVSSSYIVASFCWHYHDNLDEFVDDLLMQFVVYFCFVETHYFASCTPSSASNKITEIVSE